MSNATSIDVSINSEGYVEVSTGPFTKKISIKDFASVVNSLVDKEDQVIDNATIRYPSSVHSVTRLNDGYVVNLYYTGREAEVTHVNLGPTMIYLPNVMIRVELREVQGESGKFSLGGIRWYCTDKSRNALPTEWPTSGHTLDHIWTLPLPNIFSDSRMCTGGNRLPSVIYQDWTILDMLYYDVLIKSPFNNDLSIRSVATSTGPASWLRTLHSHWEDEDTVRFPYELLINY